MSADTTRDRLALTADDASIRADGSDTTRLTFRAVVRSEAGRAGLVSVTASHPVLGRARVRVTVKRP